MLQYLFKPILLGFSVLFIFGCATTSGPKNTYLAKVGDQYISEQEFVEALDANSKKSYLFFKKQNVDKMIAQKLLEEEAQEQHKPYSQFLNEEVFSKAVVTDEEVYAYYNKNKKKFKGKTHAQWEPEVKQILKNQKAQVLVKQLLDRVVAKARIEYFITTQLESKPVDTTAAVKGGSNSPSVKQ